jgi:hypothetical protein
MKKNKCTCGHWSNNVYPLSIMSYNRQNERAIDYICCCKKCAEEYKRLGFVLDTDDLKIKWLGGIINYPEINECF